MNMDINTTQTVEKVLDIYTIENILEILGKNEYDALVFLIDEGFISEYDLDDLPL